MNREELRLTIRRRCDMVDSDFVTDDEIDLMIDSAVGVLYDILADAFGDEYWSTPYWFNVYPGTDPAIAWPRVLIDPAGTGGPDDGPRSCYALPKDFRRLVRCQFFVGSVAQDPVRVGSVSMYEVRVSPSWRLTCSDKRAYPMHRMDTAGQIIDFTPKDWKQCGVVYRLRRGPVTELVQVGTDQGNAIYSETTHTGTVIEFLPVPSQHYAVQLMYVRNPELLPDHPFPEYLIYDCAALCLEKQGSDSSALRALQARTVASIKNDARTPDAASPPMVVDVQRNRAGRDPRGEPWQ
jgi:hypothetical protein